MSLIEGVGDEVTIVGILLLILILVITVLSLEAISSGLNSISLSVWHVYEQLFSSAVRVPELQHVENTDRPIAPEETITDTHTAVSEDNAEVAVESDANVEVGSQSEDVNSQANGSTNANTDQLAADVSSADNVSPTETDEDNREQEASLQEEHSAFRNTISIRLKYLNDTERTVSTDPSFKVKEFKRNHFADDISNQRTVRLIYNGRLLIDSKTISESGVTDGTVVHVHISSAPTPQQAATNTDTSLDISNMFMPLFAVMLGICWLSYIQYPQYFNMASVVLLIVFSLSFLIACTHSSIEAS